MKNIRMFKDKNGKRYMCQYVCTTHRQVNNRVITEMKYVDVNNRNNIFIKRKVKTLPDCNLLMSKIA